MKLRQIFISTVFAAVSLEANAQFAVLDIANLAQATKQVKAWADQYEQMRYQIDALNYQIRSTTGDRGMSTLLPRVAPSMPSDWVQSMTQLSSLAQQIRNSQAVMRPEQASVLSSDLQGFLGQAQNLSAANQAMAQKAFNDAALRQSRLQVLTDALARTPDPKAAYDLANRIAIEHAALMNDQNQLAAAMGGASAQERAQQLMIDQMRASSAGTTIPKIDVSLP
jgi:type IV secretion system protein VirB5